MQSRKICRCKKNDDIYIEIFDKHIEIFDKYIDNFDKHIDFSYIYEFIIYQKYLTSCNYKIHQIFFNDTKIM